MTSNDPPHSTVLGPDVEVSKLEQEQALGQILMETYSTGPTRLTGNLQGANDPPDRIFVWKDVHIGVEFTEVDQRYDRRTEDSNIQDATYAEFHRRGLEDQYEGMAISILARDHRHTRRGLRHRDARKAARELVDLIEARVASTAAISGTWRNITVDQIKYPALAVITDSITCSPCPKNDIRRSDGRAAPLIIMAGGHVIDDQAKIDLTANYSRSLERKIRCKKSNDGDWSTVDHTILAFHDYPRGFTYQGFHEPHEECLRSALCAPALDISAFDEIVFITYRKLDWKFIRLAGRGLNTEELRP